ncbi:hypothetical protein MKY95_10020 [Paenibacillus sp. FSL P4-0176]|uniref:hypothetical protein n=1 Tax=Paenibacillus sp. FSL P4-0176 TaxID=2921631 RepID=UPI0030CD81E8
MKNNKKNDLQKMNPNNTSIKTRDELDIANDEFQNVKIQIQALGEFMVKLYNETRQDSRVSTGQVKVLKREMTNKATRITKNMFPSLEEDRSRKSEYYKQWIKVIHGLWSIYRNRVNDRACGFSETPRIKFNAAVDYIDTLSLADYMAYRDYRWSDIQQFYYEATDEDELTFEAIVENYKQQLLNSMSTMRMIQ